MMTIQSGLQRWRSRDRSILVIRWRLPTHLWFSGDREIVPNVVEKYQGFGKMITLLLNVGVDN
jgi:hypothetical protein